MSHATSKLVTAARIGLGFLFLLFGLNGFLGFIPMPPPSPQGGAFLGALISTGYMFPFIKGTEVVVGALLLTGRYVPLALTILAPVTLNILGYHLFLQTEGIGIALLVTALQLYLAWSYREVFVPLLKSRAAIQAAPGVRPARVQLEEQTV